MPEFVTITLSLEEEKKRVQNNQNANVLKLQLCDGIYAITRTPFAMKKNGKFAQQVTLLIQKSWENPVSASASNHFPCLEGRDYYFQEGYQRMLVAEAKEL